MLVLENSYNYCQVCFLIGLCNASFSLLSRDSVNKFLIAISVNKRLLLFTFESLRLLYAIEHAHSKHIGVLRQFILLILENLQFLNCNMVAMTQSDTTSYCHTALNLIFTSKFPTQSWQHVKFPGPTCT